MYRIICFAFSVSFYYEFSKEQDYICSRPDDSGMHLCSELPPYRVGPMLCNGKLKTKFNVGHMWCNYFFQASAHIYSHNHPTNSSCVNWNQYYTNCTQLGGNPFQGTISFDNIGMAWVAIFLVNRIWFHKNFYIKTGKNKKN